MFVNLNETGYNKVTRGAPVFPTQQRNKQVIVYGKLLPVTSLFGMNTCLHENALKKRNTQNIVRNENADELIERYESADEYYWKKMDKANDSINKEYNTENRATKKRKCATTYSVNGFNMIDPIFNE